VIVDGRTIAVIRADAFSLSYQPRDRVAVTFRARGFTSTTKILGARAADGGTNVTGQHNQGASS